VKKYIIIAVVVAIIAAIIIFREKIKAFFSGSSSSATAPGFPPAPQPAAPVVLDYDKLLKRGTTGPEVKQLQAWLGVSSDGIFGPITESALQQKKGVVEITLNQYNQPETETMPIGEENEGSYFDWFPGFTWGW